MSTKLRNTERDSAFLRDLARRAASLPRPNMGEVKASIARLMKQERAGSRKLEKFAFALLLAPEPVTSVLAVPILLAARRINSRKSSGISQIINEANKELASIFLDH